MSDDLLPKAILVDLDGCLVDTSGLVKYVDKNHKDFVKEDLDAFHRESFNSPPRADIAAEWEKAARDGSAIIVLTGRPEKWRQETAWWLKRNDFNPSSMIMRQKGDKRPAAEFKREMLNSLREFYTITWACDDDPRVHAMYVEEGVSAMLVPGWPVYNGVPALPATHAPDDGEAMGLVAA